MKGRQYSGNVILRRFRLTTVVWQNRINPLNAELNPIHHLLTLVGARHIVHVSRIRVNPLNTELNPICLLLTLVGVHHILHFSRIRANYVLLLFI